MKLYILIVTSTLTFFSCTKKGAPLATTLSVETLAGTDKGFACEAGQQKILAQFTQVDFKNPETGISFQDPSNYYNVFRNNTWITLNICMASDGQLTLKRVDTIGKSYQTGIDKEFGWVDEPGPHPSLARALYDNDYSQIDFRIQNLEDPSRSIFLKGHNGFVTLSYFDMNSGNPYLASNGGGSYGRLSVVDENSQWTTIEQSFPFETGYVKLKYRYALNSTFASFNFDAVEVLDTRYWAEPQTLNPATDVLGLVGRHSKGGIKVITLGATYKFYVYQGVTLEVQYNNDGAKKTFKYNECENLTSCHLTH